MEKEPIDKTREDDTTHLVYLTSDASCASGTSGSGLQMSSSHERSVTSSHCGSSKTSLSDGGNAVFKSLTLHKHAPRMLGVRSQLSRCSLAGGRGIQD